MGVIKGKDPRIKDAAKTRQESLMQAVPMGRNKIVDEIMKVKKKGAEAKPKPDPKEKEPVKEKEPTKKPAPNK